ncbi:MULTISPECIES: hypothetical protein [Alphaproteobacteria]|uniref:DUF883 domain-containing protein n=2 Tax=Alphaproteobacteria TaxID=28211 RepID=A0A512HPU8_9HYPH|nr:MULTISPECIES: hypothetical protein [Alphaproteobacteria]GEO87478.1 hypothetical protein RNA01_44100 [Ciceribacter naphthalenivorans]GLR23554.1 hypothetical protein GCM10007920_33460 [Ciceribacter naphthalenivorans]GLT06410.1 hypothetical protein GCM10007926_33460 [Sphingomonas psychrolutea]
MTIMSEIHTLHAEIQAHVRKRPSEDGLEGLVSASASGEPSADGAHDRHNIETFLKTVNETLDEFADELGRFPRMTALAALGVGLATGVVIGRQLR